MFKSKSYLSDIELDPLLRKSTFAMHIVKKFAPGHEVHNKVNPI